MRDMMKPADPLHASRGLEPLVHLPLPTLYCKRGTDCRVNLANPGDNAR